MLEGLEDGDENSSKNALEKAIYAQGGDYVQTIPKKEPRRIIGPTLESAPDRDVLSCASRLTHALRLVREEDRQV